MSELITFIEAASTAQSNEDPLVAFAPDWLTSMQPLQAFQISSGDIKAHPVALGILPNRLLLTKVVKVPQGHYQVRAIEEGITTLYPTIAKDQINMLSSDQVTIIESVKRKRIFGLVNPTIIQDS